MQNIKERLLNSDFDKICKELYRNNYKRDEQLQRYENLYNTHLEKHKIEDAQFFSSPGRIEVAGNHTDHNNGKVICASINVDTLACVSKRNDNNILISSFGFDDFIVDITKTEILKEEYGYSIGLVRGVVAYFIRKGYKVGGFCATCTSSLYKGAGISSSACFSLLIAQILNSYYNDDKISFEELARAGQFAEYNYFGKPCGLMDQMAVAAGGITYIDFENLSNLKYERLDWPFENLDIVLVNTGGNHSELTYAYSAIKQEMNQVADYFNQDVLRKVDPKEFYKNIDSIQKAVSGRAIQRAEHYFNENLRVETILNSLKNKDDKLFCQMIQQSGDSSQTLLQNTHTEEDKEQRIDLALSLSKSSNVKVEAVRVHGGGFAGTILAFVNRKNTKDYINYMSHIFGDKNLFLVNIRNKGPVKLDI